MFSQEARCEYGKNQLAEVICQLRFPEILAVGERPPVEFQERIRREFPRYTKRLEQPAPRITGGPANLLVEPRESLVNHKFVSEDGVWRVNLTNSFISLCCNRYTCWEAFARQLDKPLAAFIQTYDPAWFERIGLRYVNMISRQALGLEQEPYRALIQPKYLGLLADEEVGDRASKCSLDVELPIRGGCRAKIHAGPGMVRRNGVKDPESKFIFDLDLYLSGKVAVNLSAGAMETLHAQAYPIFRDAITDLTHEAMEP